MTTPRLLTEYEKARKEINALYKDLKEKRIADSELPRIRTMAQVLSLSLQCLRDFRELALEERLARLEGAEAPAPLRLEAAR